MYLHVSCLDQKPQYLGLGLASTQSRGQNVCQWPLGALLFDYFLGAGAQSLGRVPCGFSLK